MWTLFLLACRSGAPTPVPTDTAEPPGSTADTAAPVPTADTAEPIPEYCLHPPPLPTAVGVLAEIGISEDFAFDAEGRLVGVVDGNLVATTRDGEVTLIAPNLGPTRGTRILHDGSYVIAGLAGGVLHWVQPDGSRTVLASVPEPNGIAVDALGDVWVTSSNSGVYRVRLDGTVELLGQNGQSLDGIVFSPDHRMLYFNSEVGHVWSLEIDAAGDPVGTPDVFAEVPLGAGLLDGMTTDACGNLYVIRMDARVARFRPDGTLDGIVTLDQGFGAFVPALNFGSGLGGFERDHLYVMNFAGGVFELDIGIEGRWEGNYPSPVP